MKLAFPLPSFPRYAIALASVAVAALLTRVLWHTGDRAVFPLFFAAVVVSACYGGLGPALLATALSGVITELWWVSGTSPRSVGGGPHQLRLAVFVVVALLTSSLNSALRRAREDEQRAKRAAEEANAAKDRFLAMVTHELRTPLNSLLLVAAAMECEAGTAGSLRKDLDAIKENVQLQARLVDDLLDVSRMSSGKLRLHRQATDLCDAIREAARMCEHEARDKKIEIALQLPFVPLTVQGDRVRLQQVFWNLVRNAIKFTPAGGRIEIAASCRAGEAVVRVSDNGIGIPPDQLERIFGAFEQGCPDTASRFGGLGLGLAICRPLTEAHGGRVTAESAGPDRGATFTVTLPAAPRAATLPAA